MKYGQKAVMDAKLEPWPNPSPERDYLVEINFPEFTCLCPRAGYPDFATFFIKYIPGDYIFGLSKLSRIVNWFARRGQIQEELGEQIADFIESTLKPRALGVVIKARHYCMIARGVQGSESRSLMVTSVMRGLLLNDFNLRNEFLKLIEKD